LTYYLIRKSDYSVYDAFRKGLRLPIPNPDNIPAGSPGQGGQYTRNTIPPKLWAPLEFDKGLSAAYKFVEDVKQDLEGINAIDVAGLTKLNSRSGENDPLSCSAYSSCIPSRSLYPASNSRSPTS
jgi:hypothetical protein